MGVQVFIQVIWTIERWVDADMTLRIRGLMEHHVDHVLHNLVGRTKHPCLLCSSKCLFLLFQALSSRTYLIILILLATPSLSPLSLRAKCLVSSLVQLVTPAELTPAVATVHTGFQDWLPTKVVHPRKLSLLVELVWGSEFARLLDKQSNQ